MRHVPTQFIVLTPADSSKAGGCNVLHIAAWKNAGKESRSQKSAWPPVLCNMTHQVEIIILGSFEPTHPWIMLALLPECDDAQGRSVQLLASLPWWPLRFLSTPRNHGTGDLQAFLLMHSSQSVAHPKPTNRTQSPVSCLLSLPQERYHQRREFYTRLVRAFMQACACACISC